MSLPHEAEITFQLVPPTGTLKNNKMIIILACRSCPLSRNVYSFQLGYLGPDFFKNREQAGGSQRPTDLGQLGGSGSNQNLVK